MECDSPAHKDVEGLVDHPHAKGEPKSHPHGYHLTEHEDIEVTDNKHHTKVHAIYKGDMDECLSVAEENFSITSEIKHAHWLPEDNSKKVMEIIKYTWNTLLVGFCVALIFFCVPHRYCVFQFHPAILFVLLFGATILLAYVEALHYANVSVEKWDMTPYKDRFPRACETQKLVKTNKLVQRFLVGRQFFVIFVVFIIAQITSFSNVPSDLWGMPETFVIVIVQVGIPGIMWVLTFGQLIPQLFVEEFTLPFLNLLGCHAVTQICFAAEFIGICHFSWLLFYSTSALLFGVVHETAAAPVDAVVVNHDHEHNHHHGTGTELTSTNLERVELGAEGAVPTVHEVEVSKEPRVDFDQISVTPSEVENGKRLTWWDVVRYLWSSFVVLGSVVIVSIGMYHHYSVLPVPVPLLFILLIGGLTLLFYLEGLMICIVATQYWDPESFKESHPRAYKLHLNVNRPEYLKRFIIGRQFFTVLTNFLIAQISVFPTWPSDGWNPVLFFIIFRAGLVGILITLSFAQLLPELLAARYPLFFMNMYGSCSVVDISLFIEGVGIGHCSWLTYFSSRQLLCGAHLNATDLKPAVIEGGNK